ncbi:enoyl-CoA hydratase/isomerase family protein [Rhodococcus sp. CX]|uniref:enoyl-CoA hydratase-related protein n=1 Tax=Rhodococcus sp. CX TaxID=2789880 RepID=UPI0018CCD760|nr:enoyl-CoA hydratase-related protein [Rhodococcus sp. CX]MBH0122621.1 enoyl-CoA hydratase/isomerase family protein [Rhodococcus sp. CX]
MTTTADGKTAFVVDRSDGIALVTFNRPDQLNTLSRRTVVDLCDALDGLEDDDSVRAIVFTGAGRAFSAGADLSGGPGTFRDRRDGARPDGTGSDTPSRDFGGILALRLFACTRPLVAAINGDAVGLGVTLTLPMDVRIVADGARFGFVFSRRGIVPEACSSWFLPRIVGISRAIEWTTSGRLVGAAEALEAGLVRAVVPAGDVVSVASRYAAEMVEAGAPTSVAAIRNMMWHGLTQSHPVGAHRVESDLVRKLGSGPDAAEGIRAFIDKRPAQFPTPVTEGIRPFRKWWPEIAF